MGVIARCIGSWWSVSAVPCELHGRPAWLRTRGGQVVWTAGDHLLYCRASVPSTVFCCSELQTKLEETHLRSYALSKGCPVASIHRESEKAHSRKLGFRQIMFSETQAV